MEKLENIKDKYSEFDNNMHESIVGGNIDKALDEAKAIGKEKCISEIKEIIKDAVKEANEDAKKYNKFYDVYEKWSINSEAFEIIIEKINNMK